MYNLFLDRQRNISIHRYIGGLHEIEIKFVKKYEYLIGQKIGQTLKSKDNEFRGAVDHKFV